MKTKRFSGPDRSELERMQRSRKPQKARIWRRVRALLLLDGGQTVRDTEIAVGGYPREILRVAKRYCQGGLQHALSEDPRPKPEHKLDSSQDAAVVALVCGTPPEGQSRWSTRLIEEVSRRGIVDRIGCETVRVMLARRDLKPWRENMSCVPEIDEEFVARMEDVLRLHARRLSSE